MQVTKFENENAAVWHLAEQLGPLFHVVPEVRMTHLDGHKLRIDMIAIARDGGDGFHRFGMIGVELKSGYTSLRDFNLALKQAIDYRHSLISDARSKHYQGVTPPFVFVYPDFAADDDKISTIYRGGYYGSVRLAGLYNVGVIRECTEYYIRPSRTYLEFRVSDTPIWRSNLGWVGSAAFGTARKRGAA